MAIFPSILPIQWPKNDHGRRYIKARQSFWVSAHKCRYLYIFKEKALTSVLLI